MGRLQVIMICLLLLAIGASLFYDDLIGLADELGLTVGVVAGLGAAGVILVLSDVFMRKANR